MAFLVACALCTAPLAFVTPASTVDRLLRLCLALVQLTGGLGLLRSAAHRPPPGQRMWRLFGAAVVLTAVATALDALAATPGLAKDEPGLTVGSAMLLLWYPLAALGLRELWRGTTDSEGLQRDLVALIEFALLLIAIGVAGTAVAFDLYRGVLNGFAPGAVVMVAWVFSVLDVLLLLGGLGLLISSIAQHRGDFLPLTAAVLVIRPVADLLFAAAVREGAQEGIAIAQVVWWISWAAVVPLARHPAAWSASMARPSNRGPVSYRRLIVLAGAALAFPLLVAFEPLHPFPEAARFARPLVAVSVVLVFARMALLVRELQRSLHTIAALERERGDTRVGALVRHVSELIMLVDVTGELLWASPSLERQLGGGRTGLLGHQLSERLHPEDAEAAMASLARLATMGPEDVLVREFRIAREDGEWRHLQIRGTNLLGLEEVGALVLVGRDVTEQKTLEDQLRHQAFTDPLTGLANRHLFMDRLDDALGRAVASAHASVALLFVDLDDFKTVNDSLGHEAGDRLLVTIADRLRHCVRPADIAARLGGDEFAVMLCDAEQAEAEMVAARILAALAEPVNVGGRVVRPAASVGIAFADDTTDSSGVLLRNADIAMYTAKATGKSRVATFRADMHAQAVRRLELKTALDEALTLDQLVLAYQPLVDTRTRAFVGAEALLRWHHPEEGLIPPREFIPLAEETGLIVPIGRWVLRAACAQALQWRTLRPDFTVSVNVSGRQLQHPGLVPDVRHVLADTGLPPSALVLELTETVLLAGGDADAITSVLAELRRLGVRLAIDDFGTGYSSLSYLQRLPVDQLKIDKSFIDGLGRGNDGDRANLLKGLVALGNSLGLDVVAEGVEHARQLRVLRQLACDYAQGYLFGRPMSPGELTGQLAGAPLPQTLST